MVRFFLWAKGCCSYGLLEVLAFIAFVFQKCYSVGHHRRQSSPKISSSPETEGRGEERSTIYCISRNEQLHDLVPQNELVAVSFSVNMAKVVTLGPFVNGPGHGMDEGQNHPVPVLPTGLG